MSRAHIGVYLYSSVGADYQGELGGAPHCGRGVFAMLSHSREKELLNHHSLVTSPDRAIMKGGI